MLSKLQPNEESIAETYKAVTDLIMNDPMLSTNDLAISARAGMVKMSLEQEQVAPGTFAMWWLGCTGIWLKSEDGANVYVDFWCGTGKQSHGNPLMKQGHQLQRMAGDEKTAAKPAHHPVCS